MSVRLFLIPVLLLLLLTLYFYANYTKLDSSHKNFEYFPSRTTNAILRLVRFQSAPKLKIKDCIETLNFYEIKGNPDNKWQKVKANSEWYIYSAYVDNRLDSPLLRILALSKGDFGRLFCRIWYSTTNSSVVEAEKHQLWIHAWDHAKPGQYLHPFLLTCPSRPNPSAVSVQYKPCQFPQNLINLTSQTNIRSTLKDFVVCLKPLNFDQNISFKLLEWLELQFFLGANKVFVYIYNVHPLVWKVLKHYEKIGKVAIKIHSLPPEESTYIKSFVNQTKNIWQKRRHEMIIYNDCFYSHIHSHRFVVNLDLDEAMVPVLQKSWFELLQDASTIDPKLLQSASMSARNVYFFDTFGELNDTSVPSYMHMLRHVYRSANFTPLGFAQKSFFRTNLTLTVSNHFALQVLRPQVRILSAIDDHLVHLHHYRKSCPPLMEKDCEDNYIKFRKKDITLWKYKNNLVARVQTSAKEIGLKEP